MAGVNPLTVSLQAGASTSISQGSTGTADYLVALNPRVPGSLTLALTGGLPSGVAQVTTGALACGGVTTCPSTFNLTPGGQCCLKLLMTGSNMALGNNIIQPLVQTTPIHTYSGRGDALNAAVTSATNNTTIIVTPNVIIPVDGRLSGALIVNNNGPNTAYNVRAVPPGAWTGVTQDATGCTTIASQGSCTLSFTSTTPYLAQGGITVTGDNITTPAPTTALAFSYNGFLIYSVSGTGPYDIKIVDNNDAANMPVAGSIWSSKGNSNSSADVVYNTILGIDETSTTTSASPTAPTYPNNTPAYTACNGKSDGSCNSSNILIYYNTYINSPNPGTTPLNYYAAGICYNSTVGSLPPGSWYLPSVCELGVYDPSVGGSDAGCGASITNIYTNLFSLGFLPDLATGGGTTNPGFYWSSTETSGNPQGSAWVEAFSTGGSVQFIFGKGNELGVRCSRALTL